MPADDPRDAALRMLMALVPLYCTRIAPDLRVECPGCCCAGAAHYTGCPIAAALRAAEAALAVANASESPNGSPLTVPWRQGGQVKRTLYAGAEKPGSVLIGLVDTPELAAHIVEIHNASLRPADPTP